MHKFMYDKLVSVYSKKSKEELIQKIMALEEIETSDRAFANQCMAGTTMYNINELFTAINEMQKCCIFDRAAEVCKLADKARNSWNYVRHGIEEMTDSSRVEKAFDDFKLKVSNAKNSNDVI